MTFLKSTILGLSLALLACGGGSDDPNSGKAADDAGVNSDGTDDGSGPAKGGTKDAGGSAVNTPKDPGGSTGGAKDAGASKTESRDGGASASAAKDGAAAQSGDASKPAVDDKGKDAGGDDLMIPNLFPDEPDAGGSTSAPSTGPRDVNGPCKDLELLCFDAFDMFIINPDDCVTCNGGMGCEGCAIPYAY